MKRLIQMILVVALVLTTASCTKEQKAKRLVKSYLKENTLTGKVKYVDWSELQSDTFITREKDMLEFEYGLYKEDWEKYKRKFEIYSSIGDIDGMDDCLYMMRFNSNHMDSIRAIYDTVTCDVMIGKKIAVRFRTDNRLGTNGIYDTVFCFNDSVTRTGRPVDIYTTIDRR